jgi:hypothetical protein
MMQENVAPPSFESKSFEEIHSILVVSSGASKMDRSRRSPDFQIQLIQKNGSQG